MLANSRFERKVGNRRWWRRGLVVMALLVWVGWVGCLYWLGWRTSDVPLDWHGLWDGGPTPHLHPTVLGVQHLHNRARTELDEGDPAFRITPGGTVLLGNWPMPVTDWQTTFSAWVKLEEPMPSTNLVALAGTAPPREWGLGAWDGHPAAWYSAGTTESQPPIRLVGSDPWPVGRWTHLGLVVDRTHITFWVDGRRVADRPITPGHLRRGDVWLGQVHRSRHYDHAQPLLRGAFGDPPPEFQIDDFVVYPRALSEAEVQGMYRVGRGGLGRTAELRDRREQLARTGTPWLLALGCLLLAASVWQETARRIVANWRLLLDPSFRLVWVILLLGGGGTALFAVRLAAASQRADRERMEEFTSDLVYRGETYFERLADLLRRARDFMRSNPDITHAELHRWGLENGVPYDFSGLDGIGWAPKIMPDELPELLEGLQQLTTRDLANEWNALTNETRWQLPVIAYAFSGGASPTPQSNTMIGWDWLSVLDRLEDRTEARTLASRRNDVRSTGLIRLRPDGSEPAPLYGVQLYLPVFRTPAPPSRRREAELIGVVFASVNVGRLIEEDWAGFPPLFGARFITGDMGSRDAIAVDTGDLFPATRRPPKPYLEKEVAIRIYGARLWAQVWTTPSFHAHSQRYWPWAAGGAGGGFTLLAALIVFVQIRARRTQERINAALLTASERLQSARNEREQLSRDLHDGAIQSLYAVQLGLHRTAKQTRQVSPAAALKLDETRTNLDGVISELRNFLIHTDPELAQEQSPGFCAVLHALAKRVPSSAEVKVSVACDAAAAQRLDSAVAVQLANIVREAISNSLRHGNPREIAISLREDEEDILRLEVSDDGQGFDTDHPARKGSGLLNIQSRAKDVGAELSISSSPGVGTRVSVHLPINRE